MAVDLNTLILISLGLIALAIVMEMFVRWFIMRDISDFLKTTAATTTSVITEAVKAGVAERTEALRTIVSIGTIDMVTDYINRGRFYDLIEAEIHSKQLRPS